MTAKVTEQGIVIPKEMLGMMDEVEIEKLNGIVVVRPITASDPLWDLGNDPVIEDISDASVNHDQYIVP